MGGGQSSDRPKKTHNLDEAKPAESVHFAKFFEGLPVLDAKVVAITGCTTGTGYAAAEACARKGAHVIMLNRQSERAEAALAKVKAAAPNARVDLVPCDLMDLDSMRSTAVKVKALVQRIDVLANNAGIMASVDKGTSSGFDIQMQTNHLSHFLLTKELMPLLEAADAQDGGEARIVNHSSLARRYPPLKRDYFEKKGGSLGGDGWGMMMSGPRFARYRQSKLANAVFTYALHDRLAAKGSKVKALVCAPGVATTALISSTANDGSTPPGFLFRALAPLMGGIAQSSEDGAMPLLTCMCMPGIESGDFYEPANRFKGLAKKYVIEDYCKSKENKDLLWDASEEAIGEKWAI